MTYESSEHESLGELILPGLPEDQQKLLMPNGIELSFGEICALAGDYFAVAKKPICFGKDEDERKNRFMEAYGTLAFSKRKKVRKILNIIEGQTKAINEAMSQGQPEYVGVQHYKPKEILKALFATRFKIIGTYFKALDHMNENATLAHQTGHLLAMQAAAQAHFIVNPREREAQLAYAYSLEAFACHYLMDHFASGHLRTPASPLYFEYGTAVGGLLTTFMHNEDNNIGINVTNDLGETWKAYGDAHIFESYNKQTKDIAIRALRIVINGVYRAYETGTVPSNKFSAAYELLPQLTPNNYPPLFVDDSNSKRIFYRAKLDDVTCYDYKKLRRLKVPYVLTHFFVRSIKENLTSRKEYDAERRKLQSEPHSLEHHSLFRHKKWDRSKISSVIHGNTMEHVHKNTP